VKIYVVNFDLICSNSKTQEQEEDELYAMSQSAFKNKQEKQVCKKNHFALNLPLLFNYNNN